MARNVPTDPAVAAMRRLARAVRDGVHKAFRVPETAGPPGDDTNLWISLADGRLYWRSPDGTIQAAGTGGSPAATSQPEYVTDMAVLPATDAASHPPAADGLLAWGAGRRSVVTLDTAAIPAGAEILHVQILTYGAEAVETRPHLHFAPVLTALFSPASPIVPVSQARVRQSGEAWATVNRVFGRMWRDGTADGFALLSNPLDASASGYITGPHTPYGTPPMARVHYQIPA